LDRPYSVPELRLRIESEEHGGRVGMNIVACRINGVPAFILRTDQNEAGTGHHGLNVIEIAAAVRLRDLLDLTDGDLVE
jgi:CTP-dependent riboflavin kinase